MGAVQGMPICFDAKETARKSFPLQNIHAHQIDFMSHFQRQNGVAFLLVRFQVYDEIYFLPFEQLNFFWIKAEGGGRKSIPYDAMEKKYLVVSKQGAPVHYLEALATYMYETNRR